MTDLETREQLETRLVNLGASNTLLRSANLDLKKQLLHARLLARAFRDHLDDATAARIEKAVDESRKENPHDLPVDKNTFNLPVNGPGGW